MSNTDIFEHGFWWGLFTGAGLAVSFMGARGQRKGSKMFTPVVRWEKVRTDAGWHLRLKAANNEIIMSTEVYVDKRSMNNALRLVRRASTLFTGTREVDERTR